MRIRPLTGQVLILLLPHDEKDGSIFIPETANEARSTPDNIYVRMAHRKAIVQEVGPWKKTKQGLAVLPEVKPGDTVVISPYAGTRLSQDMNDHLKLIKSDDILALLESNG